MSLKGLPWPLCLTGIYAALLVAITVSNWTSADRFWLGALNLYLPQAMWALPGVPLIYLVFRADPGRTWLPVLCVLWVLGPIMGHCWPLRQAKPAPGSLNLRVMTWNIKYGMRSSAPLLEEIARCRPDVVLLQDAVGSLAGPLGDFFRDWQVRSHGQYVIASRYPLSEAEVHEIPSSGRSKESFLRCRMRVGTAVVSLYNVHFKTPRRSLNAFRTARSNPWFLPQAVRSIRENVKLRLVQAASLPAYLSREPGPFIVSGDLNAPDASLVCATLREAGLRDVFAESGRGYGFTYGHFLFKHRLPWLQVSWMRIDHIMVSAGLATRRCWAGTGDASDHRPVIADLVLKGS